MNTSKEPSQQKSIDKEVDDAFWLWIRDDRPGCDDRIRDRLKEIVQRHTQFQTSDKWVSVETLPDDGAQTFFYDGRMNKVRYGTYLADKRGFYDGLIYLITEDNITHWMPCRFPSRPYEISSANV